MSDNGLTLAAGTSLRDGRYSIEAVLGQGGFGITYRAVDTMLSRLVAIKEFFLAGSVRSGTVVRPPPNLRDAFVERRDRIRDEARILARFRHPNIVTVHEFFEENDTIYVVMELLEGRTLATILNQSGGRIPEGDAVGYAVEIGAALDAVHAEGLLHRDVKPDNVMVVRHGRVVLVDFGTAREFALGQSSPMSQTLTPGYAPVEQYTAHGRFGPETDVYALGATVYHMVTGQFPIPSLDRFAGREMPTPHDLNPEVSLPTSEAIMNAMAVDSTDRPATAGEFAAILSGAETPVRSAPKPEAGAATVVVEARATGEGADAEESAWSWPMRIAVVVAVVALAAAAVLMGMSLFSDDGDPPQTWSAGDGGVALAPVPGSPDVVATLAPGATVTPVDGVATVAGQVYLAVEHDIGAAWAPVAALVPPSAAALEVLTVPLTGSPIAIAITGGGVWTGRTRVPVRSAPAGDGSQEVSFFRAGEDIPLTGDSAVVANRNWAFTTGGEAPGWLRADRLDLGAQTSFLGVPRGERCAALLAAGFEYAEAYAYWIWDGQAPSFDTNQNGVPCETEYDETAIEQYLRLGE